MATATKGTKAEGTAGRVLQDLGVDTIRTDGGTQPRERLCQTTVAEYAREMEAGASFPPIVVFDDGTDRWLSAGHHRLAAMKSLGWLRARCVVVRGSLSEARWHAAGSNRAHGLRPTRADQRRALAMALEVHPEWSDQKIAQHVGTGVTLAGKVRAELEAAGVIGSGPRLARNGSWYTKKPKRRAKQDRPAAQEEPIVASQASDTPTSTPPQPVEITTAGSVPVEPPPSPVPCIAFAFTTPAERSRFLAVAGLPDRPTQDGRQLAVRLGIDLDPDADEQPGDFPDGEVLAGLLAHAEGLGLTGGLVNHYFALPRRWRFALAWPAWKVALDVEVGVWRRAGGGNSRAANVVRDVERHNAAVLGGWRVLKVTGDQVRNGDVVGVLERLAEIAGVSDGG